MFIILVENFDRLAYSDSNAAFLYYKQPPQIRMEAGYVTGDSGQVTASPTLTRMLNLAYYLQQDQLGADSLWQAGFRDPVLFDQAYDQCNFVATVPPQLAGERMAIHAYYDSPRYGVVEGGWFFFHAFPLCTHEDSAHAMGAAVQKLTNARRWAEAVAWADSAIALGLLDPFALGCGRRAAERLNDLEKALYYLDLMQATFGQTEPYLSLDQSVGKERYASERADLLEKLRQQQRR